jgi:hypothetical protein
LTETSCDQKIVILAEPKQPFEEKIVSRKTIVYETLVDPAVIKIAAENLKDQLFSKYGFLKTKPEEVNVVSVVKHYKPYIVVSGEYTVHYYRKHLWKIKVADDVSEMFIGVDKLKPKQVTDSYGKTHREIELRGKECVKKKIKASLVLDELGRDVSLKELPSAPSERNPEEVLARSCAKKVPPELGLSILRTRIFKRPADVSWIANELFEVNERVVIYVPFFKVLFRKVKTGQEKTCKFNGLTGKIIRKRGV